MSKFKTITTVFFALVVLSITIPQAFANHEDYYEIDMQYTANPTIGESVTIDCTTSNPTSLNMLMTVFRYDDGFSLDDREVLASIVGTNALVSFTLTPQDSSMIQIFCEFVDYKGDKVGYAVTRHFTPEA